MSPRKNIIKTALMLASLLAAGSCVYPFDPEIQTSDRRIVIEGDIHLGTESIFYVSRVFPFSREEIELESASLNLSACIEGEDGSIFDCSVVGHDGALRTMLYCNTSTLSPELRYRLHLEDKDTHTVYESDWVAVCPTPEIDGLRYILDRDRGLLNVALSMHCQGNSHFRWTYDEVWEYHADLYASVRFSEEKFLSDGLHPESWVVETGSSNNLYYCWRSAKSTDIKIFSTQEQVDDRFEDLEFLRIPSASQKLQMVYRLSVHLEAIDENAYRYWRNIEENSQEQGTLFAPTPSQISGNIHCVSDPSVPVIGYIGAAEQVSREMYYVNSEEQFYSGKHVSESQVDVIELQPNDFARYYFQKNYAPYNFREATLNSPAVFWWAPASCVDCRKLGGTKTKPENWPNDHL